MIVCISLVIKFFFFLGTKVQVFPIFFIIHFDVLNLVTQTKGYGIANQNCLTWKKMKELESPPKLRKLKPNLGPTFV
jgi:hypothetical protein